MTLQQRSIDGLKKYIQDKLENGLTLAPCGGNGGDGVYYHVSVGGGAWGDGEVYIAFTNHGYIDKASDFNPYDDSIDVRVY